VNGPEKSTSACRFSNTSANYQYTPNPLTQTPRREQINTYAASKFFNLRASNVVASSSGSQLDASEHPRSPPQPGVLFWRLFLAQQQVLGLGPQPESLRSEALLIGRRRRRHRPQHTRSREGTPHRMKAGSDSRPPMPWALR
jgi:hypothetical protein